MESDEDDVYEDADDHPQNRDFMPGIIDVDAGGERDPGKRSY